MTDENSRISAERARAEGMQRRQEERRKARAQEKFLQGLARANRGEDPFPNSGSGTRKRVEELESENSRLRIDLEGERTKVVELEAALKTERLNAASRTGIYRTLFAALVGGYGVSPDDKTFLKSIPGQLVSDLANVGGNLDVKTARGHVRGAFDQFIRDHRRK